jgi:magnesium-protoporphyrin O-methyltransferase
MESASYNQRRHELEEYFDRTAADAWAKLTSDAPVGRIRATVRAGRDRMRATLLSYLPNDLTGHRVLDAGCGTGSLAVEAANRGADVVAIDLSETLVNLARERTAKDIVRGSIDFRVSDMLSPSLGHFDWIVAMDSLIHYEADDMAHMVARLSARASKGMAFTFAPSTPLLELMNFVGKAFPRGNRSPEIEPIREGHLVKLLAEHPHMSPFRLGRCERIDTGFYKSQATELVLG